MWGTRVALVARPADIPAATAAGVPAGGRQRGWIKGSSANRACAQTAAASVPASWRPAGKEKDAIVIFFSMAENNVRGFRI